jgi:transposase-like protein
MSKLSDPRKREEAFALYCRYRDMDLVASEFDVTTQTVYNWRREDKWDAKLNDLTTRFSGMMSVLQRAEKDLIVADWFSELRLLEFLELQAGQAIAIDGLRPKTWNESLNTLKFVMERKDKLFERAKRKTFPPPESSDQPSEEEGISEEQQKAIDEMLRLVQHTPPDPNPVDSVTGVTPDPEPEEVE